jgi:hypothetical protein
VTGLRISTLDRRPRAMRPRPGRAGRLSADDAAGTS